MVNYNELIQSDLKHIWHPCMQMKDFETMPPLVVHRAQGCYLYTNQGTIIDGISSWWCKSLGHGHPAILDAIRDQLSKFEHVILANTSHPTLVQFGEKLAQITQNQHVFFASDGSCAVEIAMKLALHAMQLRGEGHRREFIALQNSYHGETLATLNVSDVGLYKKPYEGFGAVSHFLNGIPYVSGIDDPLWHDCDLHWAAVVAQLEAVKERCCAIIVEPLLQGAGGMHCYSQDFLKRLSNWAKANKLYLIADEIMTGIGRTGRWLASDHAEVKPDMICLSKGLTSGTLPLSCVSINHELFELFYDDYETGKAFLHSHTYSGNALAVSAALATINVIEEEDLINRASQLGQRMLEGLNRIASITGKLTNIRCLGAMAAADLNDLPHPRLGRQFHLKALQHGALLRPLGNTIYWFPPINAEDEVIEKLAEITLQSIKQLY